MLAAELRRTRQDALVMPLGDNPLRALSGFDPKTHLPQYRDTERSLVGAWRGSLLTPAGSAPDSLARRLGLRLLPSFHPAAIERRFEWASWLYLDFQRAARWLRGAWQEPPARRWVLGPEAPLALLAARPERLAFDSESDPEAIVAFATQDAVYAWVWTGSDAEQRALALLAAPDVVKIAHLFSHDWPWVWRRTGIRPAPPWWDTLGAAHVLEPELQKELSPHCSTRWTTHAYHKHLRNTDPLRYCGMDAVVAFDAAIGQERDLVRKGLLGVFQHDCALAEPLIDMQIFGVRVDEAARADAHRAAKAEVKRIDAEVSAAIAPVVRSRISRFRKPHLFRKRARCSCCGGGRALAAHCWRCADLGHDRPKKPALVAHWARVGGVDPKAKVAELLAMLPECDACDGAGKQEHWLPINTDSSDQLADLLYRGLSLPARSYKGRETVRAKQLAALRDRHPLVPRIVALAEARADATTLARLGPDFDDRVHSVFNPWGTRHGRVASSEGLVFVGTNLQNIPEKARNVIVADDGHVFLYPDLAQVEARIVAILSQDPALLAACAAGADLHAEVARMVSEIVAVTRAQSKSIVHAGNYGEGPKNLAERLGVAFEQADAIQRAYFRRFPGIPTWHRRVEAELDRTRAVRSLTGRTIRYLSRIYDRRTKGVSHETLKRGLSFVPQDCAAWLLADGLLDLWRSGKWPALVRGVVHVHDALLIQVPEARLAEARSLVRKALTRSAWGMTFPCELKVGRNWRDVAV